MKLLFTPAIALMNRLGYPKKFALLALMSVAAFSVVAYSLFVSLDRVIQPSQRQLQGLALIKPISRTVQLIQQHRGISAALLGGNETMQDRLAAKKGEAVEAFNAMEGMLPHGLTSNEDFRQIKANWERLLKEGLHWTVAESFAAHTRLIEQIQLFEVLVADEYLLTLDTEIASSYLIDTTINKLSHTLEYLGQIRAYSTGILAMKQIAEPQQIKLKVIIGELDNELYLLNINLDKVGRYNPAMQKSLLAVRDDITDSARQITGLVASDIFTGHFATPPNVFLDMVTVVIDKGYTQMYQALLPTTKALIEARIARAKNTLYISIGITLLLLLIVAYFAIGIYHSIIDSVRSLARSARTFAGGDMSERIHLGTSDELSQIGDSFNEMADGFNAMHNQLRGSHDELHRLLNSMAEGVYGVDTNGKCSFVNRAFLQMLGYQDDDEVLDKNMHELIHHSHCDCSLHPVSECKIFRAFQTNQIASASDEVFWRKDGVAIPVEYWSHPIVTDSVVTGAIVTFVDITARKLADDMLRVAATTFETHEGIAITDTHANIIRVNQAFEDITGYSQEEVLGKNPHIRSSGRHDKAFYAAMWQQLLNNGSWTGEIWNRRKNGQIYPEWLTVTAVKNERGEATEYVGIFSDITERKQAEEKLRKYNEELEAINHQLQDTQNQLLQSEKMSSIGQLAAGVAHEINNPIGYVYSNLGTLEKYVQDTFGMIGLYEQEEGAIGDEAARARLKAARDKLDIEFLKKDLRALMNESKDGITRVKKIVQDLKDFSHVDTSDEWHFADLHKGLDSTLNIVNNEIKYKANVVREYGDIPEVECLSSQLNQVFMNLLVNAAHAIEARGTITIRTGTLRTGQQGEEVWVEIADTGKGVAPEHIKKIFDPFFTTKPIGKGTGLGLSLSYGIIQKHHGRIEVESEVGSGTTFRVWLPVKQSREGVSNADPLSR